MVNPLFLDVISLLKESVQTPDENEQYDQLVRNVTYASERDTDWKFPEFLEVSLSYDRPANIRKPIQNLNVVCYVIELPSKTPKFDPKKAKSLGVTPGPLFGKLANGEEIQLSNGTTVKPEDCFESFTPIPGPILIVVECPSEEYLDALEVENKWSRYHKEKNLDCVIHLSPRNIVQHPRYANWITKFLPSTRHLILNSNTKPILLRSEALLDKLSWIDPEIFSRSPFVTEPTIESTLGAKINQANFLSIYQVLPVNRAGFHESNISYQKPSQDEILDLNGFKACISKYNKAKQDNPKIPSCLSNLKDDVSLTFFGTGAASPYHVRNTSGMLLDLGESGSILIDPGSGTYHQMCRKYGQKIKSIIVRIKAVWVSHKHLDHHNGVITILKKRQEFLDEIGEELPLVLIGPRLFEGCVREVSIIDPQAYRYTFFHSSLLRESTNHPLTEFFMKTFGLQVQTVPVEHCLDAYGLILTHSTGWKVVFSGDTRPCKRLVELGQNCTVLVHESSMLDKDIMLALKKGHSSTSEVLHVAYLMNAYRTILTHFSQRLYDYPVADFITSEEKLKFAKNNKHIAEPFPLDFLPKISDSLNLVHTGLSRRGLWDDQDQKVELDSVIVSFDLMTVKFKEIVYLPAMLEAVKLLYVEDHVKFSIEKD
eukprot:TRINITY_DN7648_c0_g1_i1.p1 TRINITY_DN7648_c0_g1~~TRINITY_DN7648_c0_g1_i1.p1  ORF type:complete len:654 (-),score=115.41 TRINITY_DN7648_c0_g1_i1:33-1994(-)